jgi:hypothetical protein
MTPLCLKNDWSASRSPRFSVFPVRQGHAAAAAEAVRSLLELPGEVSLAFVQVKLVPHPAARIAAAQPTHRAIVPGAGGGARAFAKPCGTKCSRTAYCLNTIPPGSPSLPSARYTTPLRPHVPASRQLAMTQTCPRSSTRQPSSRRQWDGSSTTSWSCPITRRNGR